MDIAVKNHFTQDNIAKLIWRHSLVMFSAILALFAYDVFESSLIALSGATTLASLGFTLPITTAMSAIAIGISIKSHNQVVKDHCLTPKQLSTTILKLLCSATFVIVVLATLLFPFSDNLLLLLGNNVIATNSSQVDHAILAAQQHYLDIRLIAWLFLVLVWQATAMLRALGQMRLASSIMLIWLTIKASIAVILLTPESPLYQDGLTGLAYTHLISDLCGAIIAITMVARRYSYFGCAAKDQLISIKLPSKESLILVSQQLITPLSMAVITMLAAKMGPSFVAAFALIFRLETFFLLLPMVLTTSLPAIIGTNYWSGKYLRVQQIYIMVFMLISVAQLILAFVIFINKDLLSGFICPQDQIAMHIEHYLLWVPWGYLGAACAIVYQSCLNAEGKSWQATKVAIYHRLLLLLPFTFIGSLWQNPASFYQGMLVAHCCAGFMVLYLFIKRSQYEENHLASPALALELKR